MKWTLTCIAMLLAVTLTHGAEPEKKSAVPKGYKLVYRQDFASAEAAEDLRCTDPKAWRVGKDDEGGYLELHGASQYKPKHRSPRNIAMLKDLKLGNFVLEGKFLQTGREYGHRDMCIFFNIQNPDQYYYSHIATKTDNHAHNIFIVNNAARTKVSHKTTPGVKWGSNIWRKIRLERDVEAGTVRVFFEDMTTPVMEAKDETFGMGYLGFGSFDDTGKITDIRIWAPESEKKEAGFYTPLGE